MKNRFVPKLVSEPNSYSLVINKLSLKQLIKCLLGNCFFFNLEQKYFNKYSPMLVGVYVCTRLLVYVCLHLFGYLFIWVLKFVKTLEGFLFWSQCIGLHLKSSRFHRLRHSFFFLPAWHGALIQSSMWFLDFRDSPHDYRMVPHSDVKVGL